MADPAASTRTLDRPPAAVRAAVRDTLVAAPVYSELKESERRDIAHALVRIAHAANLLDEEAASQSAKPPLAGALNAADEYGGSAVNSMASTTRNMINAISFPRFVNELITGVFRAMNDSAQQQLQQYVELVRGVSQSLDGFASMGGGNDDMAKRWLAEQFPQSYAIEEPDPDDRPRPGEVPDPDDEPEPVRLIPRGPPPSADALRAALSLEPGEDVPSGGVQELIPFVRRSLARNRQQMLATMVRMGMQRIVIDSGKITASMKFRIDATSAAAEQRHSGFDTRTTIGASGSAGFGWWSASASVNSTIGYVQTSDVQTKEEVTASAELNSGVELHFRTDQVPLDRIASEQTVQRLALNTLNPTREAEIAGEVARARISADQAIETARAARPAPSPTAALAPNPAVTAPPTTTPPPPSTTPPTGTPPTGTPPTARPPTGTPPTGTAPTGTPPTGTPPTGTAPTGMPPTGTPSTVTPPTGTPPTGTPSTVTPPAGTPPTARPPTTPQPTTTDAFRG